MGIGIQGKTGGEVFQHPGDHLDVHTVLQSQGREGVSEIVKAHLQFEHPVHLEHRLTLRETAAAGPGSVCFPSAPDKASYNGLQGKTTANVPSAQQADFSSRPFSGLLCSANLFSLFQRRSFTPCAAETAQISDPF